MIITGYPIWRAIFTASLSLTAGKALVNWDAPRPRRRKPGRQRKYSNHAIETALTLGMVFHLSSRVASLVGQIDSPISSARADTAYDAGGVYEAIENHSAHRSPRVLIPPR